MSEPRPSSRTIAPDTEITLGLLNAVHEDSAITQRKVARDLGVALGLVNAYLKRCMSKGLIKVRSVPANRYAYFLTPQGFAEKSRLTAEYLSQSFSLFRQSRAQYQEIFAECRARGWNRLALVGISDLAEVAVLCAHESNAVVVGVIDEKSPLNQFLNIPVAAHPAVLPVADAFVVTTPGDADRAFRLAAAWKSPDRVLAPPILGVLRNRDGSPLGGTGEEGRAR